MTVQVACILIWILQFEFLVFMGIVYPNRYGINLWRSIKPWTEPRVVAQSNWRWAYELWQFINRAPLAVLSHFRDLHSDSGLQVNPLLANRDLWAPDVLTLWKSGTQQPTLQCKLWACHWLAGHCAVTASGLRSPMIVFFSPDEASPSCLFSAYYFLL